MTYCHYKSKYPIHIQHGHLSFEMYGILNKMICTCVNHLQNYDYQYAFSKEITIFIQNSKEYNVITNISIFLMINELLSLQDSLLKFKLKKKDRCMYKKIQHLMKEVSKLIYFYHSHLDNYSLIEDT